MPSSWMSIDRNATDEDLLAIITKVKQDHWCDPAVACELSWILAESGERIPSVSQASADIASTGGPSSLSTLLCPLFLRAAGCSVAKLGVVGRPAGGIDCLAQIPGYRVVMTRSEIEHGLRQSGYIHFLGGDFITPLDSRMFRLRQQNSAQIVPTLVAASLLSKKLAVGVQIAGLDVRVSPHGNFGTSWEDAELNARMFTDVGERLGIRATAVLSDGGFAYQPYIGRKESLYALDKVMREEASDWLKEHQELCRTITLACVPATVASQVAKVTPAELRAAFIANVEAQGGDLHALELSLVHLEGEHKNVVCARTSGFAHFDLQLIRDVLVEAQKNITGHVHPFPDPMGIIFVKRQGQWVEEGSSLATVRIENISQHHLVARLEEAIRTRPLPTMRSAKGII